MTALVDAAEGYDVVLLHENEKAIHGDTPERCLDLVESVGSEQLRLAWDPANFVQCGVAPFTGGYQLLGPHIAYVQIKDAIAATGQVVPAGAGDGQVPETLQVFEAVQSGQLGRITSGSATISWWRSQAYYDSAGWRGTWALDGGGALMNQGIHTIDLLVWFLGEPVEVFAWTGLLAHERMEVEDTAVATIRFSSGALGIIQGTTAAYPGLNARVQVHGDRGSVVIDDDHLSYFQAAAEGEIGPDIGSGLRTTRLSCLLQRRQPIPARPSRDSR